MNSKNKRMMKCISLLSIMVLYVNMMLGRSVWAVTQSEVKTKTYIVVTDSMKSCENIAEEIGDNAIEENETLEESNMLVAELTNKEVKQLNNDDGVLFIEENFELEADSTDDDKEAEESERAFQEYLTEMENRESVAPEDYEWNMKVIEANDIEQGTENSKKIKVAVLDSGVDIVRGIDLAETINLIPEEKEITPMFWDMSGHGTGVASIICGNPQNEVQGVNPNAAVYSVKVLDGENKSPVSRIVEGIYWSIENGMNIINMSFGTHTYSQALKKAIDDAYKAGILMVASSGNDALVW